MTNKKKKEMKAVDVRQSEVEEMKTKLQSLGLSTEVPEVEEIYQKLDRFVTDGISESFSIKMRGLKRIAVVNLCMRPQTASNMMLKYTEHV